MATRGLAILPVEGLGEIGPGDVLAEALAAAAQPEPGLRDGDVVVVTSKVISKAEHRLVRLAPGGPDVRELVERESVRVLRRRGDLLIAETAHGFVCANAGVDVSNVDRGWAALLPLDADRSARRIRDGLRGLLAVEVAVVVSDTFGRPWRRGVTDVALGCAGIGPILDLRGSLDSFGRALQATEIALADELAAAADLVMGKASGIGAAVVRGVEAGWLRQGSIRAEVVRHPGEDLFR